MKALWELDAAEALPLLHAGTVTAEALAGACLRRIEELDGGIGAFEHLDAAAALAEARRVDATSPRPPLAGLPVAVKDIVDTAGMPTACGFAPWRGRRPARDAACVARLRAAGAVLLGKTVTTELAFFAPGRTRNPRDPARTPGGSSSGSAAAVAARLAPAAIGTQTAGSIIRPASYCGVVGFKPTHGLVPLEGVLPFAPSLDTLGVLVRRVADVPPLLGALAGSPSKGIAPGAPRGAAPRIGLCRTGQWPLAEASTRRILEDAAARLAAAGAEVEEAELGPALDGLAEAQRTVMAAEAARTLAPLLGAGRERASPVLQELLREGERVAPARERAARDEAELGRRRLRDLLSNLDALLTPSAIGEAPVGLASTGDPAFNRCWTLLGAPCVSLPAARGPAGMPVGVQLVGLPGGDLRLLQVAAWAESALGAAP